MTTATLLDRAARTTSREDLYAAALGGLPVEFVDDTGQSRRLPVGRWTTLGRADHGLLAACDGATLDVGCGPGRLTHALGRRGQYALGVDVSGAAVRMTRARGARAICRDVFGDVPRPGSWGTVLLADGNIGIGGDPLTLLRRSHRLLRPRGRVVADVCSPGETAGTYEYRLTDGHRVSTPFRWSVVPADQLGQLAEQAGFAVHHTARHHGRQVVVLVKEVGRAS